MLLLLKSISLAGLMVIDSLCVLPFAMEFLLNIINKDMKLLNIVE